MYLFASFVFTFCIELAQHTIKDLFSLVSVGMSYLVKFSVFVFKLLLQDTLYVVLDTNVLLSHLKLVSELKDFPIEG